MLLLLCLKRLMSGAWKSMTKDWSSVAGECTTGLHAMCVKLFGRDLVFEMRPFTSS